MTLYEEIHQHVFQRLLTQLPSFLTYHSPEHTAYVVEQAEFISRKEGVNEGDLFLIKVAALFHDIGFVKQYKNHEEAGCEIAVGYLQELSFSTHEIAQVCGMIMATKIPQMPNTLNEKIVADADLEYLGTDSFHTTGQLLFKELQYFHPEMDMLAFHRLQVSFLRKHTYHTEFCMMHREEKKSQHLQQILESM